MIQDLPMKNFNDTKEMRQRKSGSIPSISSSNNKKIYLRRLIGNIVCSSIFEKRKGCQDAEKYFSFLTLDTDILSDGENDLLTDIEALSHDRREDIIRKHGLSTYVKMRTFWEIYFFLPYTNIFPSDLRTESYKGILPFLRNVTMLNYNIEQMWKLFVSINEDLLPSVERDILSYHKNIS